MTPETALPDVRRTPLHDAHVALGAKMVPFGGWEMPLQYAGIVEEHHAVRQQAGLFDVSHMGEFHVEGPGAFDFVQRMVANDVARIKPGQALYTQFTRPDGGTVDDLLVYALEGGFLLVVNASNIQKDWDWLQSHRPENVGLRDVSDETAMLALQGPRALAVMARVFEGGDLAALPGFHWLDGRVGGLAVRVARTGYTGEDGFEVFCAAERARELWDALLAAGRPEGLKPAGLGARDTLRLEAGLPLYGHELTEAISPVMAGFGWSVRLSKGDFIGREALAAQKEGPLPRRVVGLRMDGRQIARQGYVVFSAAGEGPVGEILSGTFSPTLGAPIATALVEAGAIAEAGTLQVQVRNQLHPAHVVPLPFYRRPQ